MKNDDAVFTSDITKSGSELKNNLYDLINVVPAKPLSVVNNQDKTINPHETISFTPDTNKRYIPKKISKFKVKTVRDIRALYEQDVYGSLPGELEKQQNCLMKKIRYGFSTNEHTKNTAKGILNGDKPVSTSAWQMLANINPYNHKHPKQFVLWNGRRIQVNGSRGGKTKFICNHDLKSNKTQIIKSSNLNNSLFKRKIGLLRNSLNIKFKPGPLQKKKFLDDSHHKYHMGKVELIPLPKPALDIFPSYGTPIDPTISTIINKLRKESGFICSKWAEYAVSVLGSIKNNTPEQLDKNPCISFDLNYKCNQNRLLMRRDIIDSTPYLNDNTSLYKNGNFDVEIMPEVQNIVEKIVKSVEINLLQDDFYSTDDFEDTNVEQDEEFFLNAKDKPKKKSELDRLDVTVITLPQMSQKYDTEPCGKSFCTLGCICDSLNCSFNLRQHCGVLDCMFGCKCDLSKFKDIELLEGDNPELIPGLLKLDNQLNSHLAKEEQKFHQTVIVTGEKSILLKSRKRKCRSSPKYAEFYSNNMNLKSKENTRRTLSIVDIKLNCKNIEPLCMVHNLYKCFCKGKFSESSLNLTTETNLTIMGNEDIKLEGNAINENDKIKLRPRLLQENKSFSDLLRENIGIDISAPIYDGRSSGTCARTCSYNGRKYNDDYYEKTNSKIKQMEENDDLLKIKMRILINKAEAASKATSTPDNSTRNSESESGDVSLYYEEMSNDSNSKSKSEEVVPESPVSLKNRNKYNLRAWLEVSFRLYKERLAKGLSNNVLREPKKGLSCLLPWEVILSRYTERKNVYFVSKQPPYRTFLGVDPRHPTFKSCINIDEIRFADLPKYPVLVQNLITNVTEVNNSFCMLRGWDYCWELIGSAVRIVENNEQSECSETSETDGAMKQNDPFSSDSDDWLTTGMPSLTRTDTSTFEPDHSVEESNEKDNFNLERSKWFVMKIENDFNEIQFYKRGFFVTYEGIQRSIKLARLSGKTVRLSSQARSDKNSTTQYGIYAIPSTNESCVFIGPYEEDEPLGIEIVKTFSDNKKQEKTRGVWITTNKIDNMRVIDNPLSFMPSVPIAIDGMSEESGINVSINETKEQLIEISQIVEPEKETAKIVKPIKIRRTNIIHNIPSSNTIFTKNPIIMKGPISLLKNKNNLKPIIDGNSTVQASTSVAYVKPFAETSGQQNTWNVTPRPVAEIAPQIKITSVYSERTLQTDIQNSATPGSSRMMVLKPDEINKKIDLAVHKSNEHPNNADIDENSAADVEGFLEKSPICACPDDVLVISDCEDDNFLCKPVWIQCCNIPGFGHFPGSMKGDNMLSFKIPGFNHTDFYTQSEAFDKINQILARKVYIPKYVTLKWKIIHRPARLSTHLLTATHLGDKKYLFNKLRAMRDRKLQEIADSPVQSGSNIKPSKNNTQTALMQLLTSAQKINSTTSETIKLCDFEEKSKELESKTMVLFNEAVTKHTEIGNSLAVPVNQQAEMTERLQDILDLNNDHY